MNFAKEGIDKMLNIKSVVYELFKTLRRLICIIQGYSNISTNFQKFILQVLLNIRRRAIYRLKGELSKLFSHFTNTQCEPHVWRGRFQIDNPALPTLVAAYHR
jgi:hypothetical protein